MNVLTQTAPPESPALRTALAAVPRPRSRPAFDYDVAIVGLGYVGLPTAIAYHAAGSRVLGVDVSERRIDAIRSGAADLLDRDQHRLATALASDDGTLEITADLGRLASAAAVVVCVPTPVDDYLSPDLRMLASACATVVENAVPGQVLMLTSTTYVGTTEDLLVRPLAARGLVAGRDVFVAFSAERIDPGNAAFDQEDVPRVMGAATPECAEEADRLLRRYATSVHHVGSLAAAEMTKLLENTFRAVNIALANEFADICEHLDINVSDVIDAAATKPYGFMPFRPGPGVGGHCIPCDPHYLLWQLRRDRISAPVIEHSMAEISHRPGRIVDRARRLLSERGLPVASARILVVGVSYKPDVADLRESPALEILGTLAEEGAQVGFVDAHFDRVALRDGTIVTATDAPPEFDADLVILHTRHSNADLSWLRAETLLDITYPRTAVAS
ncbi:nucleotide sugar dehydrogenase [Galbitalea sp. SE-J8]|uniref:nucleotide sugar dehydrogenase n=1 Tax=Galbitalea sp. SE-J8 TaxID=3054952 RepID=UPI00259CC01E|nr:nucleotide sugar dehydrogenase [Galbitalea sp. SE-J8]MDM4763269.1 nucleotide sugar dehydrogenase [Galbitalea sp. SE-J8]